MTSHKKTKSKKKNPVQTKTKMHPRNKNRERYDLEALLKCNPELKEFIKPNRHGEDTVDFANPDAVKVLNRALLHHYYGIANWEFPDENLCPPIPGRADYIHYIADLLYENDPENFPNGEKITALDVGVGANCIYPIIGVTEYNWKFIASDIDQKSIDTASNIVNSNPSLVGKIDCKFQKFSSTFFHGIVEKDDRIDISVCNPPFHASAEDALRATQRKVKNLSGKEEKDPTLNFAGVSNELICEGGEYKFISSMIKESKKFSKNFYWFSTLVSKESHLDGIYDLLDEIDVCQIRTIPMGTSNKASRVIAWTFLSKREQLEWREERWVEVAK